MNALQHFPLVNNGATAVEGYVATAVEGYVAIAEP